MKQNIHPTYEAMVVTCACGNSFTTGGTKKDLRIDVCYNCHPFFTGTQKFLDTLGRVDKFIAKRKAASGYVPKNKKKDEIDRTPKSLKEMLDAKKKSGAKKAEEISEEVSEVASV